jgi:membrane protein DedA with SNARE-associated domain
MFDSITEFARDAVTTLGYPGILIAMVAENLFPPIPSEIVLPLAGYEVSQGNLTFVLAVLAATLGSVVGALILYAIGRFGGRPAIDRWGRVLRVSHRDVDRAERWFDHYGDRIVFLSRMVPLIRSVVSIPAGILEMPVIRFVALTTAGSLLWNVLLIGAGYTLGTRWEDAAELVGRFSDAMKVIAVLAVAAAVVWLWRRRAATPARSGPA